MSIAPDIRIGLRRAIASAEAMTTGNVHRNATGAPVDTIIDHACSVRVLDEIAGCAAELLGELQHITLTGDAVAARIVLTDLLAQAGYVTLMTQEITHGQDQE